MQKNKDKKSARFGEILFIRTMKHFIHQTVLKKTRCLRVVVVLPYKIPGITRCYLRKNLSYKGNGDIIS